MRLTRKDYDNEAQNAGLYTARQNNSYTKFARFNSFLDPYDAVTYSREFIFFTKPDLHIFSKNDTGTLNPELKNVSFFNEMHKNYNNVLKQLQISANGNPSPFMNLLTNSANSGIDLPSLDSDGMETAANVYTEMMKYKWMSVDQNHEFSVEFWDTKYLECYRLFKTWDEYSRKKSLGEVTPPHRKYIINKELHDEVCAYKFILGEDGETILYYAKLYGVYPKNVPRDIFGDSFGKEGFVSMSIDFHADWVEDLDPLILADFNELTDSYFKNNDEISIYDSDNHMVNGHFGNMPYIVYVPKSSLMNMQFPYYKLKWR